MESQFAITIINRAIFIAFIVAAPMLIAGLLIGLFISIIQAVTQINEMTLTFIPKIFVTVLVLIIFLPWMATTLLDFFSYLVSIIPEISRATF